MTGQLENQTQGKTVLAHDVFGNQKEIPIKDLRFRASVYGVLKAEFLTLEELKKVGLQKLQLEVLSAK